MSGTERLSKKFLNLAKALSAPDADTLYDILVPDKIEIKIVLHFIY